MSGAVVLFAGALWLSGMVPQRVAPIDNPVFLNTGFVCKWQKPCVRKQQRAMSRSLRYVRTKAVPAWKIGVCNLNSGRGGTRKDWVGFDNCIRNANIRPRRPLPQGTNRGRKPGRQ